MRVACFYPLSIYSAWSVSIGLVDELRRMGHEVFDCPIVPDKKVPLSRSKYPAELKDFDLVLVSGPEHLKEFLEALYPNFGRAKARKVAWWHETVRRSDYGKLDYEKINAPYDKVFTPAKQDEEFGMAWLPFGVDLKMFSPGACSRCLGGGDDLDSDEKCSQCNGTGQFIGEHPYKEYGACFIGLLYPKRQEYLQKMGLSLTFGSVSVTGIGGVKHRETASLYASELQKMRVLVNLPSLCDHIVTKVFEAMACGTAVVTPVQTTSEGKDNYSLFQNGKHVLYYEENPRGLIESLLNEPDFRKQLATQGCKEVHEKHGLDKRCEVLLGS